MLYKLVSGSGADTSMTQYNQCAKTVFFL